MCFSLFMVVQRTLNTTIESIVPDARHARRDDCILATNNQSVGTFFYDCVAVIARIINSVFCFNGNGGQAGATIESTELDARHARRDGDGSQAETARESTFPDARHALKDGDGDQAGTTPVFATCYMLVGFD